MLVGGGGGEGEGGEGRGSVEGKGTGRWEGERERVLGEEKIETLIEGVAKEEQVNFLSLPPSLHPSLLLSPDCPCSCQESNRLSPLPSRGGHAVPGGGPPGPPALPGDHTHQATPPRGRVERRFRYRQDPAGDGAHSENAGPNFASVTFRDHWTNLFCMMICTYL